MVVTMQPSTAARAGQEERGSTWSFYRVNRPNKLLQPLELVIHDCWFAARSRASVRPIVRRARGLNSGSGSLILASVCSFLSAVAAASSLVLDREPNSLSLRFFFMAVVVGSAGWWERPAQAHLMSLLGT
jgi:hypothetical protein